MRSGRNSGRTARVRVPGSGFQGPGSCSRFVRGSEFQVRFDVRRHGSFTIGSVTAPDDALIDFIERRVELGVLGEVETELIPFGD